MTMLLPGIQQLLDQGWLRLLLAVCVLFLLHLPFSMLTIQWDQRPQGEPGIQLPAVVSLPPATSAQLSVFEKDLYAWTSIADPRRMLHPDLEHGFSHFANPFFMFPVPVLPVWSMEPFFWPRRDYPESSLAVASKPLAALIREQWNRNTSLFLLPHERVSFPEGVFWRLSGSPGHISGIQMPEDFASLAGNPVEIKKITGMTLLEVSSLQALPYPRITLRKSCGNGRFDQLAVRAVKQYLLARRRQMQVAASPSSARVVQSWILEVDWRLPQFGKEP